MQTKRLTKVLIAFSSGQAKEAYLSILGSGEPLLKSPNSQRKSIKELICRRKESHRALSLHLTTNGTLLNEEIERWLVRGDWSVKISIDGDQAIHDRFRLDTIAAGTFNRINPSVWQISQEDT